MQSRMAMGRCCCDNEECYVGDYTEDFSGTPDLSMYIEENSGFEVVSGRLRHTTTDVLPFGGRDDIAVGCFEWPDFESDYMELEVEVPDWGSNTRCFGISMFAYNEGTLTRTWSGPDIQGSMFGDFNELPTPDTYFACDQNKGSIQQITAGPGVTDCSTVPTKGDVIRIEVIPPDPIDYDDFTYKFYVNDVLVATFTGMTVNTTDPLYFNLQFWWRGTDSPETEAWMEWDNVSLTSPVLP